MDPEQTLIDAQDALDEGEHADAIDALDHYAAWRAGGGFEPTLGDERARTIRRAVEREVGAEPDGDAQRDAMLDREQDRYDYYPGADDDYPVYDHECEEEG